MSVDRRRATLLAVTPSFTFVFRLTGRVADLDDTTPDEPQHPALVLIFESGKDLARIVIPRKRMAVGETGPSGRRPPVAISGESDVDSFLPGARAVATPLRLLDSYH